VARLNLDDDFQLKILALIQAGAGDPDRVSGNAVRFLLLAQDRYKQGLIITENEFSALGFLPHLVGVFASRLEGGGFQAIGAHRMFGWLRARVQAGAKGGKKTGKTKARVPPNSHNNIVNNAESVFNDLGASKPKQTQASSSPSSSPSIFNNNKGAREKPASTGKENSFNNNNKNWLVEIWNQERRELAPVLELSRRLEERIANFEDNPAEREKWRAAFRTIAASKACNGKGRGSPFIANFSFASKLETRAEALNGTYSDPIADSRCLSVRVALPEPAPDLSPSERKAALEKMHEVAAALPFVRKKSVAENKKL
jgi:hypothetical protein